MSIRILAIAFLLAGVSAATLYSSDKTVWSTALIGGTEYTLLIADSSEKRQQGLSGVQSLDMYEGMLFIFPEAGKYGMWMKDMVIPLDMIWLDTQYKVVHIAEAVLPASYPSILVSPADALYVIEVSSGTVERESLEVGDKITLTY
ncbi:hypothetical protein CL653_01840 [bacterium]|nr:hypothetical protein [bacterium]|tara:strand:+ start:883 stop:1320 length:438 start_codon:yes stop_codon:yes gene_type:complete